MTWKRWVLIGVVVSVVGAVGGPWVYFNLIRDEAPAPLSLSTSPPVADDAEPGSTDGTWTIAQGSEVGYRVQEILFGQEATAVGRTDQITGSMQVDGTTIASAAFTVDMGSVQSDESRRDGQFRGRIMDVATYPTSTFTLSEPVSFDAVPGEGEDVTKQVRGELTLRGTTKAVTFDVAGKRTAEGFEISGSVPIVFAEWNIPNPSGGPARTADEGVLEFALKFTRA